MEEAQGAHKASFMWQTARLMHAKARLPYKFVHCREVAGAQYSNQSDMAWVYMQVLDTTAMSDIAFGGWQAHRHTGDFSYHPPLPLI